MAQHDYNIANGSGLTVRSDINDALSAVVSLNSGPTAPTTTVAYMLWYDTTAAQLKIRNVANSGWVSLGSINGSVFDIVGNAATASTATTSSRWATSRTQSLTGDVTGSAAGIDGSGNWSLATTLASSGVAAGSYTTANITVDAKGRITAASSGSGGVTSLNGQTGAITNTSVDTVGSVIAAFYAVANSSVSVEPTISANIGDTVSGGNLRYNATIFMFSVGGNYLGGDFNGIAYSNSTSWIAGGSTLSGTWRCMGRTAGWKQSDGVGGFNYYFYPGLWVRVS